MERFPPKRMHHRRDKVNQFIEAGPQGLA
ncbi:hypothetical protein CLIM01_08878 [Colletotrichum limetticola]|uniref:Uncharacterized protein n=1 Tax=Colletotrichum limetticola TaxID=1209924 RepID=A0ABQ9PQE4_9PEZI|nr:hypothetical protein CLIM01_08878 [Colletotrichum limetticola]